MLLDNDLIKAQQENQILLAKKNELDHTLDETRFQLVGVTNELTLANTKNTQLTAAIVEFEKRERNYLKEASNA